MPCESNPLLCCSKCGGTGLLFGLSATFDPMTDAIPTPKSIELPCSQCRGEGSVSRLQLANIEYGKRMRAWRVANGIGLRAAAEKWGINPSELAGMESGFIDNQGFDPRSYEVTDDDNA